MKQSKEIQHLYLRAGFGLSPAEWQQKKDWSRKAALSDLFRPKIKKSSFAKAYIMPESAKGMSQMMRNERQKIERKEVANQNFAWMNRMANPKENALLERMTLFWHGHFACETKVAYLAAQQLDSIRENALGNFRNLVIAIAKDPSMIQYLNNQQNKKNHPNENFARELMELFTIGIGNYTENDVKEAARAFTGWGRNREGDYVLKERQHDYRRKTFMEKTGDFNGEDIIDIILEKEETAEFITRKIYRYFVNEKIDETRVKELAIIFYQSNYDIEKLMYKIFASDWFYDSKNIGTKIKSPIELIVGLMRTLNLESEQAKPLIVLESALGQQLFKPPNVAGWPGGKNWIDNSTLILRLNLAARIIHSDNENFKPKGNKKVNKLLKFEKDLSPIIKMTEGLDDTEIIEILADYLLQNTEVKPHSIRKFVRTEHHSGFVKGVCARLMSLPEYQMC